tara:strand:+ start:3231 stop:3383 length:153 start_codon:yes stop_codon:yes gene_type:complete
MFALTASQGMATHNEGWGQGPEMPLALLEVGASILDGKLYVVGFNTTQVA